MKKLRNKANMHRLIMFVFLMFILVLQAEASDDIDMTVISQDTSEATSKFKELMGEKTQFYEKNIHTKKAYPISDIYITLGPRALEKTIKNVENKTVISLFSSRKAFESITRSSFGNNITAIYSDPSPYDQLELISALYPENTKVLILASASTVDWVPKNTKLNESLGLNVTWHVVDDLEKFNISELAESYDVILGIADPTIYTPETMKRIIQYSYRNKKGFIGFSNDLTRVGALASIFPTINNLSKDTVYLLEKYSKNKVLPKAKYPSNMNISINKYIARSFDIYRHNTSEISVKINAIDKFSSSEIIFVYEALVVEDKWI